MWLKLVPVTLAAALMASGCGRQATIDPASNVKAEGGGISGGGPANPIPPTYCQDHGGTIEAVDIVGSATFNYCRIDRALLEMFTLFDAVTNKHPSLATAAFLKHQVIDGLCGSQPSCPNPADVYCEKLGARVLPASESLCLFSDGSVVEAWTLFYGPQSDGYQRLATLLSDAPGSLTKTISGEEANTFIDALVQAGLQDHDNAPGALTLKAAKIDCTAAVVPNAPAECTIAQDDTVLNAGGDAARTLYTTLINNGAGLTSTPTGGSEAQATNIQCSRPVAPHAAGNCTFSVLSQTH